MKVKELMSILNNLDPEETVKVYNYEFETYDNHTIDDFDIKGIEPVEMYNTDGSKETYFAINAKLE